MRDQFLDIYATLPARERRIKNVSDRITPFSQVATAGENVAAILSEETTRRRGFEMLAASAVHRRCRETRPGATRSAKRVLLTTSLLILLPVFCDGTSKGAAQILGATGDPRPEVASHEPKYDAPVEQTTKLREGDRVRLVFYERLDDVQDRWREARPSEPAFHQFAELCGDFDIQEDGTLSLPIIGTFHAAGQDQQRFISDLSNAFEKIVGRKAFVNVVSIEHQPVYIVGNVKNPAAFKYVKGMTIMHLVALAGGARVSELESWQLTEGRREIDRLRRSLERVKRLLVRTAILRTEDGYLMPRETISGLVGNKDYATLINTEGEQRKMDVTGHAAATASLIAAVNAAREDLNAKLDRLKPLDQLLVVREQREKTLSDLVDRSVISKPALVQAQGELTETEDRKQTAMIDAAAGRTHLADAQRSLAENQLQYLVERDRATALAQRDTLDAIEDSKEGLTLLTSLEPREAQVESTFLVTRHTGKKTVVLRLLGTAELEPGDLVDVEVDESH